MQLAAYILNYSRDDNALRIQAGLPCESHIIDSSGKYKEGFIPTDAPFGAGCLNKALGLFLKSDATHILLICSDMVGDWTRLVKTIQGLNDDIGIYTPSVAGQGWAHEKPQGLSTRNIPFAEGMIWCMKRDIAECIYPIDTTNNRHSYGVDIYAAFACRGMGLKCVADDSIMMYHPFGTAYDQKEGERQMVRYVREKGAEFKAYCQSLNLLQPFYVRWYRKYLKA